MDMSHLTPEQCLEINERCLEAMVEDCYAEEDFLRDILRERMEGYDYEERLDTISARSRFREAFPDFDPETGEPWPDDAQDTGEKEG